ncbi:hypothetical protein GF386_02385 [Candidatus Pacearchaeota archaeon]|nr:hypothetical protein [Candidatus Pacearchaeota archaeon]
MIISRYVEYIVCSEFVAIAPGRARGTEYIDMIIEKHQKQENFAGFLV